MKNFTTAIFALILFLSASTSYSQRWERITNLPDAYRNNYWLDVFFLAPQNTHGWVCGFNGMVVRTTDGGATWRGSVVPGAYHLEHIHFPTTTIGYTSGPDGIFKSTDGGASWLDITPDKLSTSYWGCYFIDANFGMLVGGGCMNNQRYWRTTDGGTTWSLFQNDVTHSGLTDVIMYSQTGLGFAVSSGLLWRTNNGGITWDSISRTGTYIWHEELTHSGTSFLVPYAGTSCQGGGADGGMRFTTDGGATWNNFQTRLPMFGAFLLGAREGWACGNDKGVYYTSDGGVSWTLRNCGINNGDLDDIWFTTPDEGWVVGSGIYRMRPARSEFTKDSIYFRDVCLGNTARDTIFISNESFTEGTLSLEITGPDAQRFSIISPNPISTLIQCTPKMIVVEYRPNSRNPSRALLEARISRPNGQNTNRSIPLIGIVDFSSAIPLTDVLIIDSVYCNIPQNGRIEWKADKEGEEIINMNKLQSENLITYISRVPNKIFREGSYSEFRINTLDTGWVEAKFKVTTYPCMKDTILTVRVYAYSSIITSDVKRNIDITCSNEKIDTLIIKNTGNAPLIIDDLRFINGTYFKIIGWSSGTGTTIIQPKNQDTLYVLYKPFGRGPHGDRLIIKNNDSTKARGDKNPYIIDYSGDYKKSQLVYQATVDLGDVCIGDNKQVGLYIKNIGNFHSQINHRTFMGTNFKIEFSRSTPFSILPDDSVLVYFNFFPNIDREFSESFLIFTEPCGDTIKITLKGRGISNRLAVEPKYIQGAVKSGLTLEKQVVVESLANDDVNIREIRMTNLPESWTFTFSPNLPQVLLPGTKLTFDFFFTNNGYESIDSEVLIFADGRCPGEYTIKVDLSGIMRFLIINKDEIDFGDFYCDGIPENQTVTLRNSGFVTDTIISVNIEPPLAFQIMNLPELPLYLEPEQEYEFIVAFTSKVLGTHNATLEIRSNDTDNNVFRVALKANNYSPVISTQTQELDFGYAEICEANKLLYVEFNNSGNSEDLLEILVEGEVFSVATSELLIKAGQTERIDISAIPDLCDIGLNRGRLIIRSLYCNYYKEIDLIINAYKTDISVTPENIIINELWLGEKQSGSITISNRTNFDAELKELSISPIPSSDLTLNYTIGMIIPGNGSITIPYEYSAISSGSFSYTITITAENFCQDSDVIFLSAEVPEEIYKLDFSVDEHTATAGDRIIIPLNLLNEELRLSADYARFEFEFDRKLFFPTVITVKNGENFIQNDFSYRFGNLSILVENPSGRKLFEKQGEIIRIDGYALASMPDYTPFIIKDIELFTDKNVEITKKDGSLKVVDFCIPEAAFELIRTPRLNSNVPEIVWGNRLNIEFDAGKKYDVTIEINDIAGNIMIKQLQSIGQGISNMMVDLSGFSSGVYFIKISTEESHDIKRFLKSH